MDHRPHPPRDLVNLARGARRKSPLQVIDQPLEDLPIFLFDTHHPPKTTDVFDVAAGFRDGDRLLVLVDPVVNQLAALRK